MQQKNNLIFAVTLLIIGLANAYALWGGLSAIGRGVQYQNVASLQDIPEPTNIVTLSSNRFVVIHDGIVTGYAVDAKGKVTRVN